jgi:hypothetical protein
MATWHRRQFLQAAAGAIGAAGLARGDDRPPVTQPRATSGDAVEPNWDERLSLSVGSQKADLTGSDDKAIQAAVDYVARLGGGTVRILPGTYRLRNAVYLHSRVRILGSGGDSVLLKEPMQATKLIDDSDWYDQEVTLADPKGFRVGDGICLRSQHAHGQGETVLKRTLVARSGNRFKLDRALRENLWLARGARVATLFPLFSGDHIAEVAIENITLDGNKENNENFNGNYGGCIFLQDCNRITMRRVETRNYNGDGISWQICHDVIVEECHSHDNADLGFHPGSGSQRPLIRGNKSQRNNIGIFFCWGVKFGLAEKNVIEDIRSAGISIGHHDTDNLVRDNDVVRSGKVGVLFRPERGPAFAPHRNRFEKNRIRDSGSDTGIAIDVQGGTEGVTLAHNQIQETRGPMSRIGIRLGADTRDIRLIDNQLDGFAMAVSDLRKG